ncbi:MAG TPA: BTAD domain-containing putative transcriptional regulator, partial [Anaerolineales bacterium]|nr:BTAD domain-containing putative transcriptional regulator [Anaerolineales bacterium]
MFRLTVSMFGKLSVQRDGETLKSICGCKLQELLSYLLLHRESSHARESLATLLWGDSSTAQSKKYLRQALWQLQSALDSEDSRKRVRTLCVEPDWVSVDRNAEIWIDVAVFEQAFLLTREVAGQALDVSAATTLENAVQLYQGDFLEGCYQDWCVYERERLQTNYLIMLDKLMNYCEAKQKYETGLDYGLRVLRYDRARESTYRRMMRLHYLSGDRTGALRKYEQCAAALNEELGVKPAQRTMTLYEQIRADRLEEIVLEPVTSLLQAEATSRPELLHRLKELGKSLADTQNLVHQGIQAVEAA